MTDALTLVQSAYAAFGSGDIPAMLAMMTPDVEWQFIGDKHVAYTATVKGPSQVAEWFGAVASSDAIKEFEPQRFLVGPSHVTVIGRERTADARTGREFSCAWVHVWELREGKLAKFWGMLDTEAAAATRL